MRPLFPPVYSALEANQALSAPGIAAVGLRRDEVDRSWVVGAAVRPLHRTRHHQPCSMVPSRRTTTTARDDWRRSHRRLRSGYVCLLIGFLGATDAARAAERR
jgi:hypothetical protein